MGGAERRGNPVHHEVSSFQFRLACLEEPWNKEHTPTLLSNLDYGLAEALKDPLVTYHVFPPVRITVQFLQLCEKKKTCLVNFKQLLTQNQNQTIFQQGLI